MPIRGVLSKLLVLSFAGCATDFNTSFGSTFSQTLASGEEDCFDQENQSSLGGPRRELGLRNALSGTVSRSNSLNQRRGVRILGISPLALSRFAPSWSVEMTDIGTIGEPRILMPNMNQLSQQAPTLSGGCSRICRPGSLRRGCTTNRVFPLFLPQRN